MRRRTVLAATTGAAATAAGLAACGRGPQAPAPKHEIELRWVGGAAHTRGHRLREAAGRERLAGGAWPAPARRAAVLVLGGGVAGLAAARAFARQGIDDVHVLELEDSAGGNARAHALGGTACPLGAHYLPLPGPQAHEVAEWLHEIGLLHTDAAGRVRPDERHLCHSPQERLYFEGRWIEGLLPSAQTGSARLAQYRRFAALVTALQRQGGSIGSVHTGGGRAGPAFALPAHRSRWSAELAALDATTFASWLAGNGLTDPALTTYLDYCCRDDYGAGIAEVSAWAGVHYFASRHGFAAPGDGPADEGGAAREAVFTWPEGNAWLTQRLAAPLAAAQGGGRLHTGHTVLAVREERHRVSVLAFDEAAQQPQAWQAGTAVVALPLLAARHVVQPASAVLAAALGAAGKAVTYAPWLVANLLLEQPLFDNALGAPPAWDNVIHGGRGLGYVDATHQRLSPVLGEGQQPVLSAYHALAAAERGALLGDDPQPWAERVLAEIETAHRELRWRVRRIDLARYGHAMAVPRPGLQRHAALAALRAASGRLRFAHSDLAGYSVFEEAFIAGCEAALRAPPPWRV